MFAITERLLLRPGWPEDAPALAAAIGHREIAGMLARVPYPYSVEDAAEWLSQPQDPCRPAALLCLRDTAAIIGGIGIHGDEAELGYWLARSHWDRGFATEAGWAMMRFADEGLRLPIVRARHAIDNPASARVLAKLGFRSSGAVGEMASLGRGCVVAVQSMVRERPVAEALPLAA